MKIVPRPEPRVGGSQTVIVIVVLVVVMLTCCIGASVLLPAVERVRQAAAHVQSQNNLRQLSLAVLNWESADPVAGPQNRQRDILPPAWTQVGEAEPFSLYRGPVSETTGTIHFQILPYLEQEALYRSADGSSQTIANVAIKIFLAPGDSTSTTAQGTVVCATNYLANYQVYGRGKSEWAGMLSSTTIADGSSNTMSFAESSAVNGNGLSPVRWAGVPNPSAVPTNPNALPGGNLSQMPLFALYSGEPIAGGTIRPDSALAEPMAVRGTTGGTPNRAHDFLRGITNVSLMDGSVRAVRTGVSTSTWWSLCTPAGGEQMGADW